MNIPFLNIEIKKKDKAQQKKLALPVEGGRQSIPENGMTSLASLFQDMAMAQPDFEIQMLDVLEHLAKYNADLSYAVDNIVQLGNTNYDIFFDNIVSDDVRKEMIKHINSKKNKWYSHSGGLNSLINDLLAQCSITGAISSEIVPSEDLTEVQKVVLVSPKNIRFLYNTKTATYMPHQVVSFNSSQSDINLGLKELNPITYKYIAIRRFNEQPYAIPPFLSAIENMSIERDMLANLKHIVKQLGVFGFLQVLLTVPKRNSGIGRDGKLMETDLEYQARVENYLKEQSNQVQKSLATGFILGDKDSHEFDMKGNLANPEGAKQLFDLNTEMKISGLKQDPLMLGRNFSTTETIGRVILTKLSAQITNYQKLVASYLEDLFLLELNLCGYDVENLMVEFEQPMLGDEFKNQNAFGKKIENYDSLYKQGVISQQDRAQSLGYDEPDEEEPRQAVNSIPSNSEDDDEDSDRTDPDNTEVEEDETVEEENIKEGIEVFEVELGGLLPEFDYLSDCACNKKNQNLSFNFDFGNPKVNKFFRRYFADTNSNFSKAIKKASKQIGIELAKLSTGASVQQVTNSIIFHLYKNWKSNFSNNQKQIIQKWVTLSFKEFRGDKSIFSRGIKNIPDQPVFNLTDFRTIEYFKKSDDLYMGKFITDTSTRKKLTGFVKKKFIEGSLPLGENKKVLNLFRKEFGNLLQGEEHKLYNIISTTVNKLKNYASVSYLDQAEVKTFEIRGINDSLQCPYCSNMQGRRFSVTSWRKKIDEFVKGDPSYVKGASPFITGVFKGDEGLQTLREAQDADIEQAGIGVPPYHPHCRDHIIAVV